MAAPGGSGSSSLVRSMKLGGLVGWLFPPPVLFLPIECGSASASLLAIPLVKIEQALLEELPLLRGGGDISRLRDIRLPGCTGLFFFWRFAGGSGLSATSEVCLPGNMALLNLPGSIAFTI